MKNIINYGKITAYPLYKNIKNSPTYFYFNKSYLFLIIKKHLYKQQFSCNYLEIFYITFKRYIFGTGKLIMQNPSLAQIHQEILVFRNQLVDILVHKKSGVVLSHNKLRQSIYNYLNSSPKPTIKDKATINHKIRQNIIFFIDYYVGPHVKKIVQINDAYKFVQTMSQVWGNFQRFVFAHDFIVDRLKQFFQTVYKMSNAKDFSNQGRSEVVSVPIIAVNQLKNHYQKKSTILVAFPKIFSNFIAKQRQGTLVPRQMLKDTVAAIQSSLFDFQAIINLDINRKAQIIKNPKQCQNAARRSKDSQYVQKNIMGTVISDCQSYYKNLVKQKTPKLNPTDQIDLMGKIISQQQSRSIFYIHTLENQRKYIDTVDRILIGMDLQSRIKKQDGLIKYLRQFQVDKPQYLAQLSKFWKIYSRVPNLSLPQILKIYSQYLDEEAVLAQQKIQKANDFIPQMIRINTKNIKIVSLFGQNFQLQNKRNQKIRGMLSNQIVKTSKLKGKHTIGATNLAQFINTKFKQMYGKNDEAGYDMVQNLVNLFKILQQKVHYTKEHQKFISNRLLEEVDFSKDQQYTNIIQLEKRFVEEMQKQMGVSEVKQLLQNIRDIQKSIDHTKKLKQKVDNKKIHILNQIIIKNNTFWPQKNTFQIAPPNVLLKVANQVQAYFSKTSNIQFQYYNGVSLFRGQFKSKVPKQNFNLKNIYLIILLLLDESPNKKMLYGDLKMKIKSFGAKKQKGNIQLAKNVVQLLHIGLLLSSTRVLNKEDPKCIRLNEGDQFELNPQFDYEQQLKKNKVPPKMIKKLPVIKTQNIQMTPDWIKKMFTLWFGQSDQDEINIQKQRKYRVKQISVKCLKHAHHSNKNCSFDQILAEYNIPKHKQYRVTDKYLKQVIQQLINDEYCERVDGQRNVFKYKA